MQFQELILMRQSVRSFKADVPKKDVLELVLDAARVAPSAVNFQPRQFIVVTDTEKLSQLHACYHREWFNSAPACIVVVGNHHEAWQRNSDGKDHTDIDVAIAIDHLTLQAAEIGLGTCWVCNFEVDKVKSLFSLSAYMEPIALIPIGYPTDESDLKPTEKKRKPLDEIVEWI